MMTGTCFEGSLFGQVKITPEAFSQFSPEMKTEAVLLLREKGVCQLQAAASLGVDQYTLRDFASRRHCIGPIGGRDVINTKSAAIEDVCLAVLQLLDAQPNRQMLATPTDVARTIEVSDHMTRRALSLLEAKGHVRRARKDTTGKPVPWQMTGAGEASLRSSAHSAGVGDADNRRKVVQR